MESLTLTFGAALTTGLAFGAGPCNVSCLPFLGPVLVGRGNAAAWRTLLPFSAGRLAGYGGLGAVAGGAGQALTGWLSHGAATVLLGTVTLVVGGLLWRRAGRGVPCSAAAPTSQPIGFRRRGQRWRLPLGLFGMGAGMALNPCLPLGTVLLAAAASGAAASGLWLGFGFGVGAVLLPTLVFATAVAHFAVQLRRHLTQWRHRLERGAAALLMTLGVVTALGWVQP